MVNREPVDTTAVLYHLFSFSPVGFGSTESIDSFLSCVAANTPVEAFEWISLLAEVIFQNIKASVVKNGADKKIRRKYSTHRFPVLSRQLIAI